MSQLLCCAVHRYFSERTMHHNVGHASNACQLNHIL